MSAASKLGSDDVPPSTHAFTCCRFKIPPRGACALALCASFALGLSAPVQAQQIPGVSLPGVPTTSVDAGDRMQTFGADTAASAAPRANVGTDASALVALPLGTSRATLTFDDVLAAASHDAADVKLAAERVLQQEASLRRAWAALLPQVTLGGAWALTCLGGLGGVSCADRTTQFADPTQLEQQATLFDSIAGLLDIAASSPGTAPERANELLTQAAQLKQGAQGARDAAGQVRPVVVQPSNVFSGQLTVTLPLFQGRAFPLLMNAADAVDVARRAEAQVRNSLSYAAARAYHSAVAAQKLVAIATRQLDSATRHRAATQARVDTQTQPPLALKRAELEELRARQQLETARSAADVAVASLGLLIGRREAFDVADPADGAPPPDSPIEDLVARALSTRPDVAAQRIALTMAQRSELDAWMMFMPSLNLVASARATSFTQGFVRDPVTGTLSLTATLPLYDGGTRYAALREAASRVREETIRTRQLEERVAAQVRGNRREIDVKARALALASESAVVARTASEQAQAMFDAGVGTSLDVSDTALALFVAENEATRAELDLEMARVGLLWVLGVPIADRAVPVDRKEQ